MKCEWVSVCSGQGRCNVHVVVGKGRVCVCLCWCVGWVVCRCVGIC